jgi:hypothetical protein
LPSNLFFLLDFPGRNFHGSEPVADESDNAPGASCVPRPEGQAGVGFLSSNLDE